MIDPSLSYLEQLRRRSDALATACIHAGEAPDADGALDPPIVMSSAFAFSSAEHAARAFRGEEEAWIYGRWGNPTVEALEQKLARAGGRRGGVRDGQRHGGDRRRAPRDLRGRRSRGRSALDVTRRARGSFASDLPKLGITTTFVDGTAEAYASAMTERTRLLYVETPSNPTLGVVDIAAVAALAKAAPVESGRASSSTARSRRPSRRPRSRSAPISSCTR